MDYSVLHSIATLFAFIAFISICWWAYRPANRKRFEADGRMIIDTDPILNPGKNISGKEKGE